MQSIKPVVVTERFSVMIWSVFMSLYRTLTLFLFNTASVYGNQPDPDLDVLSPIKTLSNISLHRCRRNLQYLRLYKVAACADKALSHAVGTYPLISAISFTETFYIEQIWR
jgi:hypothetical protein